MTTSPTASPTSSPAGRAPLRLSLGTSGADGADGVWWPQSRDLQAETADLVDHFPAGVGRISRLLYSRPDWDDAGPEGRGVRSVRAARGPVKIGSFPRDDTHRMVLTLSSGERLRLRVVASDTAPPEAERLLQASTGTPPATAR